MNDGEDVEKREPSSSADGNVNWYILCGTVWRFLKILKTELQYDPESSFLGIYPDKVIIQKDNKPQCSLKYY